MATKTKNKMATKKIAKQSVEDVLLGIEPTSEIVQNVSYESPLRRYKVTNLLLNNVPIEVDGSLIETFIGGNNLEARAALKSGAQTVITKNYDKVEEYKIEVVDDENNDEDKDSDDENNDEDKD